MGPPLPPPLAPDVVGPGGVEEVALGADMVEEDDGALPRDGQYRYSTEVIIVSQPRSRAVSVNTHTKSTFDI